jgi:hypothetical protein
MKKQSQENHDKLPGNIDAREWQREHRKAQIDKVGLPLLIGRSAVMGVAGVILHGHTLRHIPAEIRSNTLARNQDKISRLRGQDSMFLNTELTMPRVGLNRAIEKTTSKIDRALDRAGSRPQPGRMSRWASNKFALIEQKKSTAAIERSQKFRAEQTASRTVELARNPELKTRLMDARMKDIADNMQKSHNKLYDGLRNKADFISRYASEAFSTGNIYSISKAIPCRPPNEGTGTAFEGSYEKLAITSLSRAAETRNEDGSIDLLGRETLARIVTEDSTKEIMSPVFTADQLYDRSLINFGTGLEIVTPKERIGHNDYTGGIATSLWKMGFINYASEDDIPYSRGMVPESVAVEDTDRNITHVRVAYDPNNELHNIVAGDAIEVIGSDIQLTIDKTNGQHNMSVSLVRAMAESQA